MSRRARRPDDTLRRAVVGLATLVAFTLVGYVSYTALGGLPWEDRYRVTVQVPSADRLIDAAEVRVGGVRVGQVGDVRAARDAAGTPVARLDLLLEDVGALPVDSRVRVRPASVLGASYVDLVPGAEPRAVPDGGSLPASPVPESVGFVDLFGVFDGPTREAFQGTMRGFGDGLAGRGAQLGAVIENLSAWMPPLERVSATLAGSDARLAAALRGYAAGADAMSPVSTQLAGLFDGGGRTFAALGADPAALRETIERFGPAARDTTLALDELRGPLIGLAGLLTELRRPVRRLPLALERANAALRAGPPALDGARRTSPPLRETFVALTTFVRRPSSGRALAKLADLARSLAPTAADLLAAQANCNVIALAGQNFSSYTGDFGSGQGPSFWSFGFNTTGAESDGYQAAEPAEDLRLNYAPNQNAQECESNNEPDPVGRMIGNPPGLQPRSTRDTSTPPGVDQLAERAGLLDRVGGRP